MHHTYTVQLRNTSMKGQPDTVTITIVVEGPDMHEASTRAVSIMRDHGHGQWFYDTITHIDGQPY